MRSGSWRFTFDQWTGEDLKRLWEGCRRGGWKPGLASVGLCGVLLFSTSCLSSNYGKEPVAEEVQPQDISDFHTLFDQNCVGCHGVDGKNGASQRLNYALYQALVPKEELKKVITYGRAGTVMPPFAMSQGGRLTDKQVEILVNGMKEKWAKPVDFHGTTPPGYYQPADANIDLADGKKIFTVVCGVCHGPHGVIGPLATPSYLSLASDQYIRTSVLTGKPDKGMPNWQTLKFGHPLSDHEITDVVGYLSSLRPLEARLAMQESKAPQPPSPAISTHTGNAIGAGGVGPSGDQKH
jgi:cytochrome c oxidase cbb3-type subunit 3